MSDKGLIVRGGVDFDGFSLKIDHAFAETGVTGIVGKSGAGKTTLLRAIAGLEPGWSGEIRLAGVALSELAIWQRGIGFVAQDAALFDHLSVEGNLAYGRDRRGNGADHAALVAALDLTALLPRKPANLSGGERQRVALGRALMSAPRLLLLDEPLGAVDTDHRATVLDALAGWVHQTGCPTLYVSHNPAELAEIAEIEAVLAGGRMRETRPAGGGAYYRLHLTSAPGDASASASAPGNGTTLVHISNIVLSPHPDVVADHGFVARVAGVASGQITLEGAFGSLTLRLADLPPRAASLSAGQDIHLFVTNAPDHG